MLVFEDIHWADDSLLEFIADHLGDRFTGPLLVVATSRPELLERRTAWGAGGAAPRCSSWQPLSDEETADVVTNLLDAAELPPELRSALLARAGGNPLFAEEYVRMLLDRGLLRSEGSGPELTGSDLPLPESVQSIIAARLDALPSDEKLLVQDAAVVGRAFWLGALAEVGQRQRWSVEHMLHELERKQLAAQGERLDRADRAAVRLLARAGARRRLRADRARAALARSTGGAAGWIESLSPERSEDRAEMLSHHYMRALR